MQEEVKVFSVNYNWIDEKILIIPTNHFKKELPLTKIDIIQAVWKSFRDLYFKEMRASNKDKWNHIEERSLGRMNED